MTDILARVKITTLKIGDHQVDIFVSRGGLFVAQLEDVEYTNRNMDDLSDQLRKEISKLRRSSTSIPVTIINIEQQKSDWRTTKEWGRGLGLLHAIFRGVHPRTKTLLLADLDGKKFQLDGYLSKDCVCRRLNAEEENEYLSLIEQVRAAKAALDAWQAKHVVKLDDLAIIHQPVVEQ